MAWDRIALALLPKEQRSAYAEQLGYKPREEQQTRLDDVTGVVSSEQSNQNQPAEPLATTPSILPKLVLAKIIGPQSVIKAEPVAPAKPVAEIEASKGSYQFPPAPLLAARKQWLPLLAKHLIQHTNTAGIDVDVLCKAFAKGELPTRLPRTQQQRWPARIDVLIENTASQEPYWQDFFTLANELQQLLGKPQLAILGVSDCAHAEVPQPLSCAIVLSASTAKQLPYPMAKRLAAYQQVLHINPKQPSKKQGTVTELPWPLQQHSVQAQHKGKLNHLSLALTSFAPLALVDVHLLRKLRQQLNWGDAGLEADLWNHPHCEHIGLGIRLKSRHKQHYEAQYQQQLLPDTAYLNALEAIVNEHFKGTYEGLKYLQQFSFDVLAKRSVGQTQYPKAWEYLQKLSATKAGDTSRVHQCQTYCHALPHAIFDLPELDGISYNLVNSAYADDLPEEWPQNFDPNKLPKTTDSTVKRKSITWLLHQQSSGKLFIQPEPNYRPIPAFIAQITAYENEPLRLISPNSQRLISKPTTIELSDNTLQLKTRQQQLSIGGITRPSWASEIGYTAAGVLYAKIIDDGNEREVHCNLQTGQWLWPAPFGEDEYGLYKDLNLHGQSQRFRWIAPGEFLMGSPEDEVDRIHEWEALHNVQISQGFWLAETTVSQALWRVLMGNDRSRFKGKDLPAERVSWLDCQKLIERANTLLKAENLSLPTEAQWEYACRAGTQTPFSTGDNITTDQANYDGDYPYANFPKGEYRQKTVPVKHFAPNPWGLYQMHGNVWEWCVDEWQAALAQAGDTRIDPVVGHISNEKGVQRVLRGGAWHYFGHYCRSAFRDHYHAGMRDRIIGLRLALGHELKAGVASTAPSRSDGDKPSKKTKKAQTQRRERR